MFNRLLAAARDQINHSQNLHSLAGNIAYAGFSLLLFLIMVRFLSKEMYGQWVIFIAVSSLLDMLRVGLSSTGAIRSIAASTGIARHRHVGASYWAAILATLCIAGLFLPGALVAAFYGYSGVYASILLYYPLMAACNMPIMQAYTYSQGLGNFKRLMYVRSASGLGGLISASGYIILYGSSFSGLVAWYSLGLLSASLFAAARGWDGLKYLRHLHWASIRDVLGFGRYATLSFVGSSLLRSSDTVIIGLAPALGSQAVAVFAIPMKLVEFVEIPLRSFTATAFPRLSVAYTRSKEEFCAILGRYIAGNMLIVLPAAGLIVIFPDFLLSFLGGSGYADSLHTQRLLAYFIAAYILILPLERYIGTALFALGRPKLNFYKISVMLLLNIVLDIAAVFWLESLPAVAAASVIFTAAGIATGARYVRKLSGFRLSALVSCTIAIVKPAYIRLLFATNRRRQ
jgi:O-antigen/teichoic acid export membrane protein